MQSKYTAQTVAYYFVLELLKLKNLIAQLLTDFIAFKSSLSNITERGHSLGNPSVDLIGN